jgi:hypothetical protein
VTDWATIAELGTAGGTLILAVATFASVLSAHRSTRLTERALLVRLRPLLLPSRFEDPPEKVAFQDDRWWRIPAGHGLAEVSDQVVYLAIALRNVGNGLAILVGWNLIPERLLGPADQPNAREFRRLTRDLYIASDNLGYWQGTFREPSEPAFRAAADVITMRRPFTIDLMYTDGEGAQRVITRYSLMPGKDDTWVVAAGHHWIVDRPDPRNS